MLIITYTSSHNHPGPCVHTKPTQQIQTSENPPNSPQQQLRKNEDDFSESFHFQSPVKSSDGVHQEHPLAVLDKIHDPMNLLFDEEPLSYPHIMTFSSSKSEENDFFDELEELPMSSYFTSLVRRSFSDERILV